MVEAPNKTADFVRDVNSFEPIGPVEIGGSRVFIRTEIDLMYEVVRRSGFGQMTVEAHKKLLKS